MRRCSAWVLLFASALMAPTARAQELVVQDRGTVEGEINGHAVTWRVRADAANAPVVNPTLAGQVGLKTGFIGIGARVLVGTVPVAGKTGVFQYTAGGAPNRRRGAWFERAITEDADGMLGPGAVAQPVVTFQLRPAQAGEIVHRFVLEDRGYAGMGIRLGDLFVQFDPASEETIATASAAAALVTSHGGAFIGQPSTRAMRFGIMRPVRTLRLDRPLAIGGLTATSFVVRLQDYGDASAIAASDRDPDEIVVTARVGKSGNRFQTLTLGRDALANCSSVTFDKRRRQIAVSCAQASINP